MSLSATRLFHSCARAAAHRVGPPNAISNMRPIIYDDDPAPPVPSLHRHPYSLSEFPDHSVGYHEFHYKMKRRQLDAFHEHFWHDSNSRFQVAKQEVLDSLPQDASPLVKEQALSNFYRKWVMQESSHTQGYTNEWRHRNWELLRLWAQRQWHSISSRLLSS